MPRPIVASLLLAGTLIAPVLVSSVLARSALAQTQPFGRIPPPPATALPAPALSEDASPTEFLRAAEGALAAGRIGEAQQAMEMAQTRLLDRSATVGTTWTPSDNPAVKTISQGLEALGVGDRMTAARMIQAAIQAIGAP